MAKQKIKGLKVFGAEPSTSLPPTPKPSVAKAKLKPARRREASLVQTSASAEVDFRRAAKRPAKAKAKVPRKKKIALPLQGLASEPLVGASRRPAMRQGRPSGRLERLEIAIEDVRTGALASPRTRKLLASGVPKMAQKVIEEAAETAIEAIRGDRGAFILESVDLFYNVLVLCSELHVPLSEIWSEMDRREHDLGLAEKMPKSIDAGL